VPDDEEINTAGLSWLAFWDRITGSYIIRDVESGEVIAELRPVPLSWGTVEVSPDGSLLYKGDWEDGVWVYDTMTWELVAAWNTHEGGARGYAVSPDGLRLVTTGNDDLVKVWDVSGIRDRTDVFGPPPLLDMIPVPKSSDAAWLADDRLALFLADGAKWLEVSLSVEDLVAEAQARLTRSFTEEECSAYLIDPCPTLEEIMER
jgi:WD40 repeat protein